MITNSPTIKKNIKTCELLKRANAVSVDIYRTSTSTVIGSLKHDVRDTKRISRSKTVQKHVFVKIVNLFPDQKGARNIPRNTTKE